MKTKYEKRNIAIQSMQKEIDEIESQPEEERFDRRLKFLKESLNHLINLNKRR